MAERCHQKIMRQRTSYKLWDNRHIELFIILGYIWTSTTPSPVIPNGQSHIRNFATYPYFAITLCHSVLIYRRSIIDEARAIQGKRHTRISYTAETAWIRGVSFLELDVGLVVCIIRR